MIIDMSPRYSEEELFERLKSSDVSIIYSALANIANHYGRNCEAMKVLEKYSAIENIISYLEHPKLSSLSVSIIADACLESSLVQEIIKNNAITVLIRIMKSTVTDQIRSRACRALGNIALSELGFTSIPGKEIVPVLVQFLTETVDVNHQQTALRTLRILGKSFKNRIIIMRENTLTLIVDLLHSSHKKVLLSSIKTLSELSTNCSKELGNQLIELEVHTILVELYSHAESPAKKCALTILKNMSYCYEIKSILIKAGAVNIFIKAANNLEDTEVSCIAILALCRFLDRVYAFGTEEKHAILKIVIKVLQIITFKNIHEHIVAALFPLSFTSEMTEVLRDYKIVTVLIHLLKYFIRLNKMIHIDPEPKTSLAKIDNFLQVTSNDKTNHNSSSSSCVTSNACGLPNLKEEIKKLPNSFPSISENTAKSVNVAVTLKEIHFQEDEVALSKKLYLNKEIKSNLSSLIDNSKFCIKSRDGYSVSFKSDPFAKMDQISSIKSGDSLKQLKKHNIAEENCKLSKLGVKYTITSSVQERKRKAEHSKESSDEFPSFVDVEHKRIKNTKEQNSIFERKVRNFEAQHIQKTNVADHHILRFLLQIASHKEIMACLDFTSKANFTVLLDYIYLISNPDPKALSCLLKVVGNVNCFERLVINGFFIEMEENIMKMHDFEICFHCSQTYTIYQHIYIAGCCIAESNYGIGILRQILTSPEKQIQLYALHTISRLVKKISSLLQLLILADGLSLLMKFLSDTSKSVKIRALLCLCELYQNLKRNFKNLKGTNDAREKSCYSITQSSKCTYENDLRDVTFALDGGKKLSASRKDLCQNSEYFDALLNGHFLERSENLIILPDISAETLTVIFHFLHGCQVEYCLYIQTISLDVLLELLSACERLLLTNIKAFAENKLLDHLHPNTIFKIYSQAKLYNSTVLLEKVLDYILSIRISQRDIFIRYFEGFMSSLLYPSFIDDLKKTIECKLPNSFC